MSMRIAVITTASLMALTSIGSAQSDVDSLLARAAAYVEHYQRELGSVVSEERYEQTNLTLSGPIATLVPQRNTTILRSDFLLVRVPDLGWVPFRDVFERNGVPVRDRQDRLTTLFMSSAPDAMEQAKRIVTESSRYNVGAIARTVNVPTVALQFLTPQHRSNFSFKDGRRDTVSDGRVIEFSETGRPTIFRTIEGGDQPVSGRFWIDEASGAVLRSDIRVKNHKMEGRIIVSYEIDPTLHLRVPARMEERYFMPRDRYELTAVATYSNFRRFTVTTHEEFPK